MDIYIKKGDFKHISVWDQDMIEPAEVLSSSTDNAKSMFTEDQSAILKWGLK
jgi:hypothetical protein